jgi:5'(3')-deoxyribonucleotidase
MNKVLNLKRPLSLSDLDYLIKYKDKIIKEVVRKVETHIVESSLDFESEFKNQLLWIDDQIEFIKYHINSLSKEDILDILLRESLDISKLIKKDNLSKN